MSEIILVGLDPGSNVTGYGVIAIENRNFKVLEFGCIKTRKNDSLSEKLDYIYKEVETIITQYGPDEVIVEKAFYAKNVKSTLILGHVRGILLLAGQKNGAHVVELSPKEIKRFVTGNGSASKEKVKYMTIQILKLKEEPRNDDEADALATALAHGLSITKG